MATRVKCLSCAKNLIMKEELAGKRVKCPQCGTVVLAPTAAPITPATPAGVQLEPDRGSVDSPAPQTSTLPAPPDSRTASGTPATHSRAYTLQVYLDLADSFEQQQDPGMRDLFLMLAADAALRGGRAAEAELLRVRLLRLNPDHLLKPYVSFAEAVTAPDIRSYLDELRHKYPVEVAEGMSGPSSQNLVWAFCHTPIRRPLPVRSTKRSGDISTGAVGLVLALVFFAGSVISPGGLIEGLLGLAGLVISIVASATGSGRLAGVFGIIFFLLGWAVNTLATGRL